MTTLLTFLRMSGDNEIIAMKAGGVSIYRLLPPVVVFSVITCILTGYMSVYGIPWGHQSIKALTIRAAAENLGVGLKERTFNDSFKGVMLYLNKIDIKTKELIDVFIEDQRGENIVSAVIAPRGKLFNDPTTYTYQLRLYDGVINRVDIKTRAVHSIQFETYDVLLDLKKVFQKTNTGQKGLGEMSLTEIRNYLKDAPKDDSQYLVTLTEYHKKFSIPVACLTLGLLAVPLGVQARTTKRSFGLALGICFFLLYYILLSAGWVLGEAGDLPPAIGIWLPNLAMIVIGVFLLIRTARERPVRLAFLLRAVGWIVSKLPQRGGR
jgi:lipopolysaccharide export system permease protein